MVEQPGTTLRTRTTGAWPICTTLALGDELQQVDKRRGLGEFRWRVDAAELRQAEMGQRVPSLVELEAFLKVLDAPTMEQDKVIRVERYDKNTFKGLLGGHLQGIGMSEVHAKCAKLEVYGPCSMGALFRTFCL